MAQKREYFMWSGNVRNLPFPEQITTTARAGFDVLTFSPYDWLDALRAGLSSRDLMTMADDAGIRIDHMDPISRWAPEFIPDNITEPAYLTFLLCDIDDFLRIGDTMRITSMTAICSFPAGKVIPLDQLVDGFGKLCDRAAPLGMRVDLEFVPMWGLRDLKTAWAIVKGADRPNSGLIFDFYHFMRGDPDEALLETIPSERIVRAVRRLLVADDQPQHQPLPGLHLPTRTPWDGATSRSHACCRHWNARGLSAGSAPRPSAASSTG